MAIAHLRTTQAKHLRLVFDVASGCHRMLCEKCGAMSVDDGFRFGLEHAWCEEPTFCEGRKRADSISRFYDPAETLEVGDIVTIAGVNLVNRDPAEELAERYLELAAR